MEENSIFFNWNRIQITKTTLFGHQSALAVVVSPYNILEIIKQLIKFDTQSLFDKSNSINFADDFVFRLKMFRSLNKSIKTLHKLNRSSILVQFRSCSQYSDGGDSKTGKNGHYDIIIVGGGATGISLCGSIGKFYLYFR